MFFLCLGVTRFTAVQRQIQGKKKKNLRGTISPVAFPLFFYRRPSGHVHLFTTKLAKNQYMEQWITLYDITTCMFM